MVRKVSAPNLEPEESAFKLPAEKEHLFQVVDIWNAKDVHKFAQKEFKSSVALSRCCSNLRQR